MLIGLSVFLIFFLKPVPTCTDGRQNQGEEGVDCGGPCSLSCLEARARPLHVLQKVEVLHVGTTNSSILLRVENSNSDIVARQFDYVVEAYDAQGNLLGRERGRSFIYAQEAKYLLIPNLTIPARDIDRVEVTFENPKWISHDAFPKPNVDIQSHRTLEEERVVKVKGIVVNKDSVTLPRVQVLAFIYGRYGALVGASYVELEDLLPKEARAFVILHPALQNVATKATKVVAYALRP